MSTSPIQDEGCVESCMTATIRKCICGCGGANHGIKATERLDFSEALVA